MIKFFRRIRQRLLTENKISKYLIYSIGEIVLVVIGILIALSINNNNERNKDRAFENKMLVEINLALERDIKYISDHTLGNRTKAVVDAINFFERLLLEKKVASDSIRYHFYRIDEGLSFQINEGPYVGLKSTGLDKITNDSLRSSLMYLYDFAVPRYKQLIEWNENRFSNRTTEIMDSLTSDYTYRINEGQVRISRPIPSSVLWVNPDFIELIGNAKSRTRWNQKEFGRLLDELQFLKNQIEKEITKG